MRLYSCLISTLLGLTMFCSAASQQILPSDTMVQTRNKLNSNFTNLDTASTNYATIAQGAKADAAVPSTTSVNVKAWGANGDGQTNVPATVIDARAISLGYGHGLALLSTGRVVAWGANGSGQTNVPTGLSNVTAISAGAYTSMAVCSNGNVVAWGENGAGQTNVPSFVTGAIAVASGREHSMALLSGGRVVAWGLNDYGQTNVPACVVNAIAIAAGDSHSVALLSGGAVVAWGRNTWGQTNVPSSVVGATAIAAGNDHTLALLSGGSVVAWGLNTMTQTNVPASVVNATAIAAGNKSSMALLADHSIVKWGDLPTTPTTLLETTAIACGYEFAAALYPTPTNITVSGSISALRGFWDNGQRVLTNEVEALFVAYTNSPVVLGQAAVGRDSAVAIGTGANAAGGTGGGIAIGYTASAQAGGVAIGYQTVADRFDNVAIGTYANARGAGGTFTNTTVIGTGTAVSNSWFHYGSSAVIDPWGFIPSAIISSFTNAEADPKFITWTNNTVIRLGSGAYSSAGIAIGHDAHTTQSGVSIGSGASGDHTGVAIGQNTYAEWTGVAVGDAANGGNDGAAVGKSANANNYGAAIGEDATALASGAAVGNAAIANTNGAAVGAWAWATNMGVAVGSYSRAPGPGNVAVGGGDGGTYASAVVPSGFSNTVQMGVGTATSNGWFHYRTKPVIDPTGGVHVTSLESYSNRIWGATNGWICNTNFIPAYSNAVDLGSTNSPWRDLYLGGHSIYMMGSNVLSYTNGQLVSPAPIVSQTGTNAPIAYLTAQPSYTPYLVAYALTNTIDIANGNYQYYAPTNTTTLLMPAGVTNQMYSLRIDVEPGTKSFTLGTNNVLFTTNDVLGVGASTITIRTNAVTPLLFDKAFNSVNWRVYSL